MYFFIYLYQHFSGREVAECVSRIRLVSWLVIGALSNAADGGVVQQPVAQDATCTITDHIQVIECFETAEPFRHILKLLAILDDLCLSPKIPSAKHSFTGYPGVGNTVSGAVKPPVII